jgi:hypothetical protein
VILKARFGSMASKSLLVSLVSLILMALTEIIGNGSEVTIVVSTYDYDNKFGKGKGSRLEKVRVDKLVKYEKEEARSNDPDIPF